MLFYLVTADDSSHCISLDLFWTTKELMHKLGEYRDEGYIDEAEEDEVLEGVEKWIEKGCKYDHYGSFSEWTRFQVGTARP